MNTKDEKRNSILADLAKIKASQNTFCVPDNNCGIFVLQDGEQIEFCGQDQLVALCELLGIKIEWEIL